MTSQMRAVDAAFLAMERPNEPSHVGSLLVFGPSEDGPLTVEAVRAALDERLPMMPSARRVIDGSFRSLRRPGWRRAERIDLDVHVRPHHLPGGVEARHALHDLVAQLHARPLRRDRPLWEIHVIDGLGEDTVAVFAKIHLAAMDDTTGVDLMTALLDTEEGPEPTMEEVSPRPDLGHDEDSALDRLVGPVPDQLRRSLGFPVRVAGRAAEALGEQLPGMTHTAAEMARRTPGLSRLAALVPQPEPGPGAVEHPTGRAPRLSYNEPIGPTRRFAAGSLPTGDLLRLKAVLGRSFHTAALVVCTGALRRWLSAKDELPSSPVVAIMPVRTWRTS
ncbi:MAG: wax ester/triacylglycerol synthase domain-containing protein [Actinomycetota bacterium]